MNSLTTLQENDERPFSLFERWPSWFFYIPVVIYCLFLSIRYRSLSLPTVANPRIKTGGLCGESKSAFFQQASQASLSWVAPFVTLHTKEALDSPKNAFVDGKYLHYPVIVKPDIGCHGNGIKYAENESELKSVLQLYPRNIQILIQNYVPWRDEAGIFYVRSPHHKKGHVTSLTVKHSPFVVGDGIHPVSALIKRDKRLKALSRQFAQRLGGHQLDIVPRAGENYQLLKTGNHCKGASFINGWRFLTAELEEQIDKIMYGFPEFYFGRLDIRFRSLKELQKGRSFRIIEINGIGGEACHIWDRSTKLKDAYKTVFQNWKWCYAIGSENQKRGYKPCGLWNCLKAWNEQRILMNSYPPSD